MVASRCTREPRSSANSWVSASHICGKALATSATGQLCWQICWPTAAGTRGGGVAIGGQDLCQRLDGISPRVLLAQRPVPGLDVVHPSLGDGVEGVGTTGLGELPQGSDGKRVIGRVVVGATGIGEAEHPGRASSPPSPEDSLFPGLDDPILGEGGEMTTDCCGGETQSVGKLSSR